jgi:hypothetical protein
MEQTMDGILLQRSEFMVLLDAVQASGVVGLPRETFPREADQFRTLVLDGINRLQMRGLLRKQANVNVLNTDLLAMAAAVAHPQLAVLTTRDLPGTGQQLYLHYETSGLVVEQTFPEDQAHRLVALSNRGMLIERLNAIVALPTKNGGAAVAVTVPQAALAEAKARAEENQGEAAIQRLTQAGLAAAAAKALVESFQSPQASSALVLMKCDEGRVTSSRNAALVQGPATAWLITPAEPESAGYLVQTATAATLAGLLRNWMLELAPPAPRVLG